MRSSLLLSILIKHIGPLHTPKAVILMTGGILEMLLVSAEGIGHRSFFGKPKYYVIIQCGTQMHRSKISSGRNDKTYWNGKYTFEFPHSEWKNSTHLKLRIMEKELFGGGRLIGETIIHLGGLITEGYMKGYMELTPAQYNVVLEDDTYKGMIEVGLMFIAKKEERRETKEPEVKQEPFKTRENELKEEMKGYMETKEFDGKEEAHSIYKAIVGVLKSCWKRVFSERTNKGNKIRKSI